MACVHHGRSERNTPSPQHATQQPEIDNHDSLISRAAMQAMKITRSAVCIEREIIGTAENLAFNCVDLVREQADEVRKFLVLLSSRQKGNSTCRQKLPE